VPPDKFIRIDDFGTGYSSFSYLRQFRVSKIEIDRSFIRDVAVNPDDAAITAAIISMAKNLNLKVHGTYFVRVGFPFSRIGSQPTPLSVTVPARVGLALLGGFVVLWKVYFFSVPLTSISISLACYIASIALSRV